MTLNARVALEDREFVLRRVGDRSRERDDSEEQCGKGDDDKGLEHGASPIVAARRMHRINRIAAPISAEPAQWEVQPACQVGSVGAVDRRSPNSVRSLASFRQTGISPQLSLRHMTCRHAEMHPARGFLSGGDRRPKCPLST